MHLNAHDLLQDNSAVPSVRDARGWFLLPGDQMLVERFDNDAFDLSCGNAGDRSDRRCLGLSMEVRQRDIVAIAVAGFMR